MSDNYSFYTRGVLYWASVISVLGRLYAGLAAAWPHLFDRALVRHGTRDPSGYRLGMLIVWRLPVKAALLIAALSALPLAAAAWLAGWSRFVVEALLTLAVLAAWLAAPPGQRLTISPAQPDGGQAVFVLRAARDLGRALLVLVVFGLLPSMALGAVIAAGVRAFN